jgi:hypothetical protein
MDSFLDMCDQLSATQKIISKCRYKNADISSLECAMKLFEPSFDIYKSLDLPPNINDKACAEKKVNEIMKTYQKIAKYTQK